MARVALVTGAGRDIGTAIGPRHRHDVADEIPGAGITGTPPPTSQRTGALTGGA